MTRLALVLAFSALSVLAAAPAGAATTSLVLQWGGSSGSCDVCGDPDYACSGPYGSWNSGQATFSDPVPSGSIVTGIEAVLQGVGEDASATVTVGTEQIGGSQVVAEPFSCGSCQPVTWTETQTFGWPGYVYGGTNTFTINTTSNPEVCVNWVDLTITYDVGTCDDDDGDGYEDAACGGLDCDDGDYWVNPSASETCDFIDNDCDSDIDEGFDGDGDGWSQCNGDCDDFDYYVNPNESESCNGQDDDCDGSVDEGFDLDNDGWATCEGDCNDNISSINPGMSESCFDGLDNDCDGDVDAQDTECAGDDDDDDDDDDTGDDDDSTAGDDDDSTAGDDDDATGDDDDATGDDDDSASGDDDDDDGGGGGRGGRRGACDVADSGATSWLALLMAGAAIGIRRRR